MKVLIDSCSLLSLARYYLRFDKKNVLLGRIENEIRDGRIVIIDKVYEECKFTAGGLVFSEMKFLEDKKGFMKEAKSPAKTNDVLPLSPSKFYRQVDNNFVHGAQKNRLTAAEYEVRRKAFLESADMRLVLLGMKLRIENAPEGIVIVTEESESNNDNKMFKKLPIICKTVGVKVWTLPMLLEYCNGVELNFD
jgi:hypothetical protein